MAQRFIKVTKTKWDGLSAEVKSTYNNSIVFIDGETTAPNQIYTNGKIYAIDSIKGFEFDENGNFYENTKLDYESTDLTKNCHLEGSTNALTQGSYCHIEGILNTIDGFELEGSHMEGSGNTIKASYAHAEGSGNTINENATNSHVSGEANSIFNSNGAAFGDNNVVKGVSAVAFGSNNIAGDFGCIVTGQYSLTNMPEDSYAYAFDAENGKSLIIGNGTHDSRSNAYEFGNNGVATTIGSWGGGSADYAEMFEWTDGNPDKEDRVGYFVNLTGNKIDKANSKSNNIIGIVSATAIVLGDNPKDWHNMYETDEWGRIIYEDKTINYVQKHIVHDEQNNLVTQLDEKTKVDRVAKLNPDYNKTKLYIPRNNRPEWSAIGLLGKLLVRQDGSLKVGDYCTSNDNGIATKADKGYYVMEVISDTQVKILFK